MIKPEKTELNEVGVLLERLKEAEAVIERINKYWDTSNPENVKPVWDKGEMPGNMSAMSILYARAYLNKHKSEGYQFKADGKTLDI